MCENKSFWNYSECMLIEGNFIYRNLNTFSLAQVYAFDLALSKSVSE